MKQYRITYAMTREDDNIYTAVVEAQDMFHAYNKARQEIDQEHGFLSSNTIAGISILELKD